MADDQRELQTAFLAHLSEHADGLSRDCHPDHITASALVVSHDRSQVLLNLHGRYQIWMQFGGHCEPDDASLAGAALRETVEESGIDGPAPGRRQLRCSSSRHEVQCGPIRPSHHLDVRYVAVAPAGAEAGRQRRVVRRPVVRPRRRCPTASSPRCVELIALSRWL